jgi:hypothetical protein
MAYEASEIMTAAALQYSTAELDDATESLEKLRMLMINAREKIKSGKSKVVFGDSSTEVGFLKTMDESDIKMLTDLAIGISAAKAIKEKLPKKGSIIPYVYMTGNVWPKDVQKFRISTKTFKDYNSSDILVSEDKKYFWGISLKKKPKVNSPSPTLINKAFDTILNGKQFDEIKQELYKKRVDYFSNIVVESVKQGYILESDISNFKNLSKEELFTASKRDKNKFGKYAYIDTKGSAKLSGGYLGGGDSITKDPKSMRYFVNKKLSQRNNDLFKTFVSVLNEHSQLFSDTLIDIILKEKLYDELDSKDIEENDFSFYLMTGIANISKSGKIEIGKASAISLRTTLCGLSRIKNHAAKQKPKLEINEEKSAKSQAAKIFLQLKWGTTTILDLEIRYKGSFTSQPQFQATLGDDFEKLLKEQCSGGKG